MFRTSRSPGVMPRVGGAPGALCRLLGKSRARAGVAYPQEQLITGSSPLVASDDGSRRTRDALSAPGGGEPVEALFLLVAERAVEFRQRRLDGIHRLQHGLEPLLHRFEPNDRGERLVGGAV